LKTLNGEGMISACPYGNSSSIKVQILAYMLFLYLIRSACLYREISFYQQAKHLKETQKIKLRCFLDRVGFMGRERVGAEFQGSHTNVTTPA